MVYKIILSLKSKYCHVVCICCCRRRHNPSTKRPVIIQELLIGITGSICHLFTPVRRKEHIILAIVIAILVLTAEVIRCLSIEISPAIISGPCRVTVIHALLSVHTINSSNRNIIARTIADRQIIRITISVFDGDHIFIQLTVKETVVTPAKNTVFHAVYRLNPGSRVNVFPGMYSIWCINISYQRFTNIGKWSCRAVRYGNTNTFAAVHAAVSFCAVIEIILILILHYLSRPCFMIVRRP